MKYAGLAFQLAALVAVAAWLGGRIDRALGTRKPYFTALLVLLFTVGFFYRMYLDLTRRPDA
jgi:hypothetical protein